MRKWAKHVQTPLAKRFGCERKAGWGNGWKRPTGQERDVFKTEEAAGQEPGGGEAEEQQIRG